MGFLANYQHDVFVSYAHGDILTPWSEALRSHLENLLNDYLELRGDRRVDVWMDYRLEGNRSLDQLRQRVEQSALLLTIISNPYLDSPWCNKEISWFGEVCKSRALNDGRLFVVRYRETSESRWPDFLKDSHGDPLPGYVFYSQERGASSAFPFGHPTPQDADDPSRRNFYAAVQTLAEQMGNELKRLTADGLAKTNGGTARAASEAAPSQSGASAKPTVILAAAVEEMTDDRDALYSKLSEAGFQVLPKPEEKQIAAAQQLLKAPPPSCGFAAMVLGKVPGRNNEIEGEPLALWQHNQITRHGLKSVLWLPPSVDVSGIRDEAYRDFLDKVKPARDGEPGAVAAALKAMLANPGGSRRFVFVDMPESQIVAQPGSVQDVTRMDSELRNILVGLNARVFPLSRKPLAGKDLSALESYRKELRTLKAKCDGIMLLLLREDQMAESWLLELERDVVPSAPVRPRCALVDATGLYKSEKIDGVSIFQYPDPSLREELQKWLG